MSGQVNFTNKAARMDYNQSKELTGLVDEAIGSIPLASTQNDGLMSKEDKESIGTIQTTLDGKADKSVTDSLSGRLGSLESDKADKSRLQELIQRVEALETTLGELNGE